MKSKGILTLAIGLAGCFTACDKSNGSSLVEPTEVVETVKYISLPAKESLSKEAFLQTVAGNGWACVAEYLVNEDGYYEYHTQPLDVLGATTRINTSSAREPVMYFSENKMTRYFSNNYTAWSKHYPPSYQDYDYTYQDNEVKNTDFTFTVLSATADTLKVLNFDRVYRGNQEYPLFSVFRKLNTEEVDYFRTNYITDHELVKRANRMQFSRSEEGDWYIPFNDAVQYSILSVFYEGYGWKRTGGHLINEDGSWAQYGGDQYDEGINLEVLPTALYLEKTCVTLCFKKDNETELQTLKSEYDESKSRLVTEDGKYDLWFIRASNNGSGFSVVEQVGTNEQGNGIFAVSHFSKMTAEEVKSTFDK